MIMTLLIKWWWIFFNDPALLWNKLMRTLLQQKKAFTRGTNIRALFTMVEKCVVLPRLFQMRRNLQAQRRHRYQAVIRHLDQGIPLSTQFSKIRDRLRNKDVYNGTVLELKRWRWCFICRRSTANHIVHSRRQLLQFKVLLQPFCPNRRSDSVNWQCTTNQ